MRSLKLPALMPDEQGATLVEFAFVFLVLAAIMFGIMDFSRFVYADHFVASAAREGTRFAAVRGSTWTTTCASTTTYACIATPSMVTSYVQGMAPMGITASSLTVNTTWPGTPTSTQATDPCVTSSATTSDPIPNNNPGCYVQVVVSYPFQFMFPFMPTSTWTVSSTSVMVISE